MNLTPEYSLIIAGSEHVVLKDDQPMEAAAIVAELTARAQSEAQLERMKCSFEDSFNRSTAVIAELRHDLEARDTYIKHLEGDDDTELYFWSAGGNNNLHSLVNSLKVVIRADQLRDAINRSRANEAPGSSARVTKAVIVADQPDVDSDHSDNQAVDRFASAMKLKLAKARDKGRGGWDSPQCSDAFLAEQLVLHLAKSNAGTFEDVANFAMMLHQRGAAPSVLVNATIRPASANAID